jgi:hypothetical protein
MATYGLMADYALGTALDSLDAAEQEAAVETTTPEATQPRAD